MDTGCAQKQKMGARTATSIEPSRRFTSKLRLSTVQSRRVHKVFDWQLALKAPKRPIYPSLFRSLAPRFGMNDCRHEPKYKRSIARTW